MLCYAIVLAKWFNVLTMLLFLSAFVSHKAMIHICHTCRLPITQIDMFCLVSHIITDQMAQSQSFKATIVM